MSQLRAPVALAYSLPFSLPASFPPSTVLAVPFPRSLLVFPTPLLAAICQLLNLAADLFPQLIRGNYFVLVCRKAVALPLILSPLGALIPVPTYWVVCRQRVGPPSPFTEVP